MVARGPLKCVKLDRPRFERVLGPCSAEPAFITTMMAQSICEAEKKRKAYVKKPEEEAGGNQVAVIKRGRRKTNVPTGRA